MTIRVKRQADEQHMAFDDNGPIEWHASALAAIALAKAARPDAKVVIQHLRVVKDGAQPPPAARVKGLFLFPSTNSPVSFGWRAFSSLS